MAKGTSLKSGRVHAFVVRSGYGSDFTWAFGRIRSMIVDFPTPECPDNRVILFAINESMKSNPSPVIADTQWQSYPIEV